MSSSHAAIRLEKEVLSNLESAATTSASTLDTLRALLGCSQTKQTINLPKHPIKTAHDAVATKSGTTLGASSKVKSTKSEHLKICENPTPTIKPLPAAQKRKFATQAFNVSLKSLSNLAKTRQNGAQETVNRETVSKVKRSITIPLQVRSPNKQSGSSNTLCSRPGGKDELEALADCAILALDQLRSFEQLNDKESGYSCRLEQGASVLIEKLVTLELTENAIWEALKVYEQYTQRKNQASTASSVIHNDTIQCLDVVLSKMLGMSIESEADMRLVSSLQCQILRLAILIGPRVISSSFISSIALSKEGSPAQVVLNGIKAGFVSEEKAGQQLRTIAQALLKLYSISISDKARVTKTAELPFTLLVEALGIKCESWKLLRHEVDVEKDFWGHFRKGIRRFETEHDITSNDTVSCALKQVHLSESTLEKHGWNSSVPCDVIDIILDLLEKMRAPYENLSMFDKLIERSSASQPRLQMIPYWRILNLKYKHSNPSDEDLVTALNKVLRSFPSVKSYITQNVDLILLHGARLRKTVTTVIRDAGQSSANPLFDKVGSQKIVCCIDILLGIVDILAGIHRKRITDNSPQEIKPVLTCFVKVVEAIIDVYRITVYISPMLQERCNNILHKAVEASKEVFQQVPVCLQNGQEYSVLENQLIQISDIHWRWYAKTTTQTCSLEDTISTLVKSCHAIDSISPKAQSSAFYGMKLQKLASTYLMARQTSLAGSYLEQAIDHFIKSDVMSEITCPTESNSIHIVWSRKGTKSHSLARTLSSLSKLRLTYEEDNSSTDSWIYDRNELDFLQRNFLFEAQVTAIIDHVLSQPQLDALKRHVHMLLNLDCDSESQIYRWRLMSLLLKMMSKSTTLTGSLLPVLESFLKLNTSPTQRAEAMCHLVHIQWHMQPGCVDIERLKTHTNVLCSTILSHPETSSIELVIHDIQFTINQLRAVADWARLMSQNEIAIQCLTTMKHVLLLCCPKDTARIADNFTQLANYHIHTGNTVEAGKSFAAAEMLLNNLESKIVERGRWAISYIKYLLELSDIKKAVEIYTQLAEDFASHRQLSSHNNRQKLEKEILLSASCYIASCMALRSGNLTFAAQYARQSVKLSTEIWQIVSKSQIQSCSSAPASDTSLHNLSVEMSSLSLSFNPCETDTPFKGSAYWPYIDLHYTALRHMFSLAMRFGVYQDAIYYAEHLKGLAEAIGSKTRITCAAAALALVHAKANNYERAESLLKSYDQSLSEMNCLQDWNSALWRAETLFEIGSNTEATLVLNALEIPVAHSTITTQISKPAKAGIQKPPIRGKPKSIRPIKAPAKRPGQQSPEDIALAKITNNPTYSQEIILHKCKALRNQIGISEGTGSPQAVDIIGNGKSTSKIDDVSITNAMIMLQQALADLSSDAVKCVLAETAVALPVRYRSSRKSGRVSFLHSADSPVLIGKAKNGRNKGNSRQLTVVKQDLSPAEKMIVDAQKLLQGLQHNQTTSCSSDMLHVAYKLQTKLALLCSTIDGPFTKSSSQLVMHSLMPYDIVQGLEKTIVQAERATKDKTQVLTWPIVAKSLNTEAFEEIHNVQLDDLSTLPENWSVISLSLADNQQELLVSKIVHGRSPFLLRIPLSRSDAEMDENEEFTFVNAKRELSEIIDEANNSAHDTRGQGDRETRKAWYSERQSLDSRLETWLNNIETIWFGGFRGLMSSDVLNEQLVSKFGQMLDQILDKHLPSRRKPNNPKTNKVNFHAHVLELFLSLGHPDDEELDDATIDLLYFVIDILQFSGEQNAYDEIDFDAMLVDTFDAMRTCHNSNTQNGDSSSRHTILILDKEMASFPWESLPCLKNRSVSRMPSLSSIMERIRTIREQAAEAEVYTISADKGACILNPSSDLTATQATFQPILQSQLSSYTSIINKPVTEAGFTSLLTSNPLLLYFGHGSGAQYIRGRTIRNLDTCAVTLLMGCSSAKMTECGKFESYGMPGYYMNGMSGCMAVVGTLWDVTDRDIDRFALKTMLEWGLVEETKDITKALEKANKKNNKNITRSRSNTDAMPGSKGSVTLSEAVNKGRDACLLRYLNGAAPVIYGVPVVLA